MSIELDFEAWRCSHNSNWFCPDEGCTLKEGCARERGWHEPTRGGRLSDLEPKAPAITRDGCEA
jgi:hypothetical protein